MLRVNVGFFVFFSRKIDHVLLRQRRVREPNILKGQIGEPLRDKNQNHPLPPQSSNQSSNRDFLDNEWAALLQIHFVKTKIHDEK